jgi:hypothetical protein
MSDKIQGIISTNEIINRIATKHSIDEQLLKKQYYAIVAELINIVENTDEVAIMVDNLGTFFLPLVNCRVKELEGQKMSVKGYSEKSRAVWAKQAKIYTLKREKIEKFLKIQNDEGKKKRPYAKTFFYTKKILNE